MAIRTQRYEATAERSQEFTLQVYGEAKGLGVTRCLSASGCPAPRRGGSPLAPLCYLLAPTARHSRRGGQQGEFIMDLPEFLAKLAETPRDWRLDGSYLRRGDVMRAACPLTAIAGSSFRLLHWRSAARVLDLDPSVASKIAGAADDASDSPLRAALLAACGLPVHP